MAMPPGLLSAAARESLRRNERRLVSMTDFYQTPVPVLGTPCRAHCHASYAKLFVLLLLLFVPYGTRDLYFIPAILILMHVQYINDNIVIQINTFCVSSLILQTR